MIRILRGLLVAFTFLFNIVLAVFLGAVGILGWASGEKVHFELIPGVEGDSLVYTLIGAGIYGMLAILIAVTRQKAGRLPMLVWNLLVVSLLVCALTRPSYRFNGMDHFWNILYLSLLALLALWGSWTYLRHTPAASAETGAE